MADDRLGLPQGFELDAKPPKGFVEDKPGIDLSLLPDNSEDVLSMSATFDMPPSQAYENYDILKAELEKRNLWGTAGKSFMAGIGDVYEGTGSALKWQSVDEQAEVYGDFGKRLQRAYSVSIPPEEFTWRRVMEPEWWATSVARSVPFTLSLMPAAILAAYGGGATATAVGLGAFGKLVLGSIGAAAVSRPMESALEAGNTYQSEIDKGRSEAEAEEAANFVFKGNLALTGLDIAEFAAAFTPLRMLGNSATKSLARRILATGGKLGVVGGLEAGEEGYQEALQRLAADEEIKFDPEMKEAMTIGGIFGVGMGGTGSVYTALRDKVVDTMPPDMKTTVEQAIQTGLEAGLPQQQAELKALDEIADTPEGKEHIETVMETLKDPEKVEEAEVELEEKVAPEPTEGVVEPLEVEAKKYKTAEEFVEAQEDYVRYSPSETGVTPDSKAPYQMFVEKDKEHLVSETYGEHRFTTTKSDAVDSYDIEGDVIDALERHPDILEEYQTDAESLAQELHPENIAGMDAGLWDNQDLVGIIWEEVLEPKGITKIRTPDGMLVFDPAQIKTKAQLTDIWNKAHKPEPEKPKVEEPPIPTEEPISALEMPWDLTLEDLAEIKSEIANKIEAQKLYDEISKALKQKPIKGVKGLIHKAVGITKVKDIMEIDHAEALKISLKRAAKAFKSGNKAGVEKEKTRIAEIKAKQRAKEYVKKLAKQISKEPGASIDFFYREAIENLQAGIDPSFRAKKTLKSRERTREFLRKYPEAAEDMPTKLLKMLDKTSLNDLTVAELEEIAEKIEDLREIGKLKRGLKLKAETRQHDKNVEQIVGGITNNEPIDITKEPIVFSTTQEGIIKKIQKSGRAMTLTPSRIFDKLDGAKAIFGDITHKLFYDDVNVAVNNELRNQDRRFDAGTVKREELGITLNGLNETRKVGKVEYRIDEMIGVYCAEKNPLSKLAIMYGNNLTEETIADIIDKLTPQEKAWGDYVIKDYEENHSRLREEVIEAENRDLGHQENYTPIRRVGIDYKTSSQEIMDEVLMKKHFKKGFAEKGFTIDRKSIPAEFQKPIDLNVTSVWFDQVYKQEHYVHFAKLAKQLHKIVADKKFAIAVESVFGKEYHTAIKHYVDRIANPSIYKAFGSLEKASRALRQNMVIAYLSGNLATIGKQLPSVFFYLRDATPKHLFGAMAEFSENPEKMINFVKSKDPQMKHRMIEREMEELKTLQRNAHDRIIKKVGKVGMKGIYMMDRVATTIGWMGVYNRALSKGKSEAEAIRLAQNATLRTQPAAHAKDVAELYATNEFLNWFTQFTNQLNKIYNITTYDIPADVRNEKYYNAILSSIGMSLGALTIWVMAHRRLPEDGEDIKNAFKEQAINAIPLFGKAISAGTSGWKGSNIPVMKSAEALGILMSDTSSKAKKRAIIEAICVTLGIPYTGTKRVVKALTEKDTRELIGGKPRD